MCVCVSLSFCHSVILSFCRCRCLFLRAYVYLCVCVCVCVCLCVRATVQVLVRDYGRYDLAQLRFPPGSRLGDNLYVRADGTRSYFFSLKDLRRLATGAGLEVVEIKYLCRTRINRKKGMRMQRVWVHARFRKPDTLRIQL